MSSRRPPIAPLVTWMLAMALRSPGAAANDVVTPVLERPALSTALAAHAVLLGIARAGSKRLVAVGERGIVVVSDDFGSTWRQAVVPVSVTLTAVTFASAAHGWAVGHNGVILRTTDGGLTWRRTFDGVLAARAARDDAARRLRAAPHDARKQNDLRQAEQLLGDGADKPFLAVHFFDERRGIVAGAYGLIFATADGGTTWKPLLANVDNAARNHIYAIAAAGTHVYLAGEAGLFERSTDAGRTFARLRTPYRGTYFSLAAWSPAHVFVAGLRGNAYTSGDGGATFARLTTAIPVSFSSVAMRADGSLVLTTQAGGLSTWQRGRRVLAPVPAVALPPLGGVTEAADRTLVVVGMGGVNRLGASGSRP